MQGGKKKREDVFGNVFLKLEIPGQKGAHGRRLRLQNVGRKPFVWLQRGWRKYAAAGLLTLCIWGVFYPELALPSQVCQKADGSVLNEEDYENILNAQEGDLQIRFSFLEGKRKMEAEDGKRPDEEGHREDDEVGSAGIQGEAHRGI